MSLPKRGRSSCLKIDLEDVVFPEGEKVKELDYTCPICNHVLCCPLNIPECGHLFCAHCLQEWYRNTMEQERMIQCPVCRHTLSNPHHYSVNSYLQKKIDQLKVKCINYKKGCSHIAEIRDHGQQIQKHLQECEYQDWQCSFCSKLILVRDKALHIQQCEEYIHTCPHCQGCFRPKDFKSHQENPPLCSGLIACPNKCQDIPHSNTNPQVVFCFNDEIYIKISDIQSHQKTCPARKIECPVCAQSLFLKQVALHFSERLHDPPHQEYFSHLWMKAMLSAPLDILGVAKVPQRGDMWFLQQKNFKWMPVRILDIPQTILFETLDTTKCDSDSLKRMANKTSSSRQHLILQEQCHFRLVSFDDGFDRFLMEKKDPTLSVGSKILAKRNGILLNGHITHIDNQQVCLNAKDWFHTSEVTLNNENKNSNYDLQDPYKLFYDVGLSQELETQKKKRKRTLPEPIFHLLRT